MSDIDEDAGPGAGAERAGAEVADAGATRCGFVAVIGAPNAGKSTLVNALVGAKVTIVSHKVQTTRMPLRGIAVSGNSQLVFIDTPGIFKPRRRLDRAMVDAAWGRAADADIVALMIDAQKGLDEDVERILNKIEQAARVRILIVNKVDRVEEKERLLALVADLTKTVAFDAVFLISALSGSGVAHVREFLGRHVPPGPWHFPPDEISDAPMRVLAAEITREKIYERLHQELPYSATVETTSWQERRDKSVRIEQTIFVERDSQRSIVLGKGGRAIKQISTSSREELCQILEQTVHLFLTVKVRENWSEDPARYREMGLDFPKD